MKLVDAYHYSMHILLSLPGYDRAVMFRGVHVGR
jgi:hypothetical protein